MFVLREVFDTPYDEIGKTPAAVRQVAHRARNHVEAGRVSRIDAVRNPEKLVGLDVETPLTR